MNTVHFFFCIIYTPSISLPSSPLPIFMLTFHIDLQLVYFLCFNCRKSWLWTFYYFFCIINTSSVSFPSSPLLFDLYVSQGYLSHWLATRLFPTFWLPENLIVNVLWFLLHRQHFFHLPGIVTTTLFHIYLFSWSLILHLRRLFPSLLMSNQHNSWLDLRLFFLLHHHLLPLVCHRHLYHLPHLPVQHTFTS